MDASEPMTEGKTRIRLRFPDRAKFDAFYRRDLSKGGFFLRTRRVCPVGSRVEVHFVPEGTGGVVLEGHVVLSVPEDEAAERNLPPGMGIHFSGLTEEVTAAVQAYLAGVTDDIVVASAVPEDETGTPSQFPVAHSPPATGAAPPPSSPSGVAADVPSCDAVPASARDAPQPGPPEVPPSLDTDGVPREASSPGPGAVERKAAAHPPPATEDGAEVETEIAQFRALLARRQESLYAAVGVAATASAEELQAAFQNLKKRFHPDRFQARATAGQIRELTDLYETASQVFRTLLTPERRVAYDIARGALDVVYRSEADERVRKRVFGEYRARYAETFKDRVRKAEGYFRSAQEALAQGKPASALNWLRLAVSFDPLNEEYRAKLRSLSASG